MIQKLIEKVVSIDSYGILSQKKKEFWGELHKSKINILSNLFCRRITKYWEQKLEKLGGRKNL